jgi:hypothetical protein
MASGFEMRVGHAERDAVAAELREHYAAGRLTLDELNERLDKVFAAKTKGDLNALMTDLPSGTTADAGARLSGATSASADGSAGWNAGTGSGWDADADASWGANARRGAGQAFGAAVLGIAAVTALLVVGSIALFGVGTGRPFGIVLILAAFAFLRRIFFGRRRGVRGGRPRRRW